MIIKYNINIDEQAIQNNFKKLTNQIYKLLPNREEGIDWIKPLETIMEELAGMSRLILKDSAHSIFLTTISKLEGLYSLTEEEDFSIFRRTIFECLGLIGELRQLCQD